MSISALIQLFKSLVKTAYSNRNNPEKWEGWIEVPADDESPAKTIKLNGKFTKVSVELTSLVFEFDADGQQVRLEGRPNLKELDVYIDGEFDPEAAVVVRPRGTLSHPLRTAVDFRPVTWNGDECRFNLRFRG